MISITKQQNKKLLIISILSVISVILLHVFLLTLKMPTIQAKKTQKPIKINLVHIKKPIKKPTAKTIKKSVVKPKIKNTAKPKLSVKKTKTTQKKLTQPIKKITTKTEKPKIIIKKKLNLKKQTLKKAMIKKEMPQAKPIIKTKQKPQLQIPQKTKKVITKNNQQKQSNKINKLAKNNAKKNNTSSVKQSQTPIFNKKNNSANQIKNNTKTKDKNIAKNSYNFSNSEIQWKKQPILTLPNKITDRIRQKKTYIVTVKAKVDNKGNIISLQKIKSCGNGRIDKQALKSAKQAKFIPFKRNGVAVSGNVIFSLIYHL